MDALRGAGMRVDGKPEGLRQSMAWLHTWSGLLLGWLLYAVFFTGTLSYFVDEVNDWMRPELHVSVSQADTAEKAFDGMNKLAPDASNWQINLPNARQTAVEASWRPEGAPAGRDGMKRAYLDAGTGEVLPVRETRGGSFLYRFHFELYAMPRIWGRWIVGIATMVMFIAIISGVITHKKIFTDFFTFRPRKGQRSWLDAHNALAVLALPFHIVITFSGLLLLLTMLMPWGAQAVYDGEPQRFNAERRGMQMGAAPSNAPRGEGRDGRGESSVREAKADAPTPMAEIGPMLAIAQRELQGTAVGSISVQNPNTSRAVIELRAASADSLLAGRGPGQRVVFDGVTGAMRDAPAARAPSAVTAVMNSMVSVHLGRFADAAVRWLLFLSGVVGTCMAGTGLVMWVVKRQPDRRKLGYTPKGHRLVEVLNVAAIAGLSMAVASYFWANRLLPAEMADRSNLEINVFFGVWLLCLLHAAVRPHVQAWREQMTVAACALVLLPLLNPMTGGASVWQAMSHGQWSIVGFDGVMLTLGVLHGAVVYQLHQRRKRAAVHAAHSVSAAQKELV